MLPEKFTRSLNTIDGKKISIPPTLLITAVSLSDKKNTGVSFKKTGDRIWLIGPVADDLSGSYLYEINKIKSNYLPDIDLSLSKNILHSVYDNIDKFKSLHDVSDGGLICAVSEMLIGSDCGAFIEVPENLSTLGFLFSESPSRFIAATDKDIDINDVLIDVPSIEIGVVDDSGSLSIKSKKNLYKYSVKEIENAYFSKRL